MLCCTPNGHSPAFASARFPAHLMHCHRHSRRPLRRLDWSTNFLQALLGLAGINPVFQIFGGIQIVVVAPKVSIQTVGLTLHPRWLVRLGLSCYPQTPFPLVEGLLGLISVPSICPAVSSRPIPYGVGTGLWVPHLKTRHLVRELGLHLSKDHPQPEFQNLRWKCLI